MFVLNVPNVLELNNIYPIHFHFVVASLNSIEQTIFFFVVGFSFQTNLTIQVYVTYIYIHVKTSKSISYWCNKYIF